MPSPESVLPELLHQLLELIGHLGDAVEAGVRQGASPIAGLRLAAFIGALGVDGDAALADIGVLGDAGDLLLAGVSAHSRHAEVGGVALQRPPRQWTTEALWQAYEQVEANRVKGASKGKHLTDLISLARHALGVEEELVSFQDQAAERFAGWLAQQANRGRIFSEEQLGWLELIRDQIVVDLEVRMEDLDEPPFAQQGGLGTMYALFGDELGAIVQELNEVVAA